MFAKLLLTISGFIFVVYGVACWLNPALPAGYIGMELGDGGGAVEFIAMYGGLQTALGAFFIHTGLREQQRNTGLACLALFLGALGVARLSGILIHGSDSYNVGAVVFELGTAALAMFALLKNRSQVSGN